MSLVSLPSDVRSDVTEYFNHSLGDDYETVMIMINRTDPYNCFKQDTSSFGYRHPVTVQKGKVYNRHRHVEDFVDFIENHTVMKVTSFSTNKKCEIESKEILNFCPSTGELILYEVFHPIDEERLTSSLVMFDEGNKTFIGFTKEDEIIDYYFDGFHVSFTVFNNKTRIYRHSYYSVISGGSTVGHHILKTPGDFKEYGKIKLCPDGPDLISGFKPKYTSLEKVMWTSKEVVSRFEQRRRFYNKCVVLFPDKKKEYDQYWNKFRTLNENDFNVMKNKVDQILISLDNKSISEKFKSDTEKLTNSLTGMIDRLTTEGDSNRKYSLESCDQMVGRTPDKIGQRYSKVIFDPEFVKSIELK